MTRSFINHLCLAAVLMPLAFSCTEDKNVPTIDGTFKAVLPETKTALDGTSFGWEAGDILYFSTDVKGAVIGETVSGAAEIVLSESQISADRKTATFALNGIDSRARYFFLYTTGHSRDMLAAVSTAGKATVKAADTAVAEGDAPGMLFLGASSNVKGNTTFNINSVLVPVRFNIQEDVKKVTLEGLGGETLVDDMEVATSGAATMLGTGAKKVVTAVLDNKTHLAYFFLSPGITLNGYKLTAYSDDSTVLYEYESADELTTVSGGQSNIGNIKKPEVKIYYDQEWEKGNEIVAGGMSFSKAASGLTAIHVTSAAGGTYMIPENLSNTVLFVDPDVTVTVSKNAEAPSVSDNVLIVGNLEGVRTTLDLQSQFFLAKNELVVKNVKFINPREVFFNNLSEEFGLVLDNCYFCPTQYVICPTKFDHPNNAMKHVVVENCDWDVAAANTHFMNFHPQGPANQGYVRFNNNVVYSSVEDNIINAEFLINAYETTWTTLEVKNNTFLNVSNPSGNAGFFQPANISTSISIDKNIVYAEGSMSSVNTHNFVMLRANGNVPAAGNISSKENTACYYYQTDPEFKDSEKTSLMCSYLNIWAGDRYGWTVLREETPFDYVSVTSGKFETKAAWSDFGAVR